MSDDKKPEAFTIEKYKELIRESGSWSQLYATTIFNEWLVTTVYRQSSAMFADRWYEETFVWKLEGQRKLVAECPRGTHWSICARIVRDGGWIEVEDE